MPNRGVVVTLVAAAPSSVMLVVEFSKLGFVNRFTAAGRFAFSV